MYHLNQLFEKSEVMSQSMFNENQSITDEEACINFYHHFLNNVLSLKPEWSKDFLCYSEKFHLGQRTKWMSFMALINSEDILKAYGVADNKSRSLDNCSFKLYKIIQSKEPTSLMPKYIIGLPNVRGHCFLIAAVLPLFHCYPFIEELFTCYGNFTSLRNRNGMIPEPKPDSEFETPLYWTYVLYKLYREYFVKARKGFLSLENCDQLEYRINLGKSLDSSEGQSNLPAFTNNREDLELDRQLIKGLCASLKRFCSDKYASSGGLEQIAYQDLIYKLCAENTHLYKKFCVEFRCDYLCSRCTGICSDGKYRLPFIMMQSGKNFQQSLDNLVELFNSNKHSLVCERKLEGVVCGGRVRKILALKLINKPKILTLGFPASRSVVNVDVPERVEIDIEGQKFEYERYGSTNCFDCWTSEKGQDYEDFYHVQQEGDKFKGSHTYVTLWSQEGFVEVNNGVLYTCDDRLFGKTTWASLHYYQATEYASICSKVDKRYVEINPEW